MESDNGRFYHRRSTPTTLPSQASLRWRELERPQHGHSEVFPQYPCYHPHPLRSHEFQEVLHRELRKEHIREEMIVSEIFRRESVLVSEVRREKMLAQELAPTLGSDDPLLGSRFAVGLSTSSRLPILGPRDEELLLGGRVVPSLMERDRRLSSRNETGGYEVMMAPRGTSLLKISEVDPAPEMGKENERIMLWAEPDKNVSGVERKDSTPPPPDVGGESSLDGPSRKKAKNEWTCAVCNVSATSEQGLKEHLQGKKHKSKEATMKAQTTGRNYCIGFYPKKATKPVEVNPEAQQQFTSEILSVSKAGDTSRGIDAPVLQDSRNSKKAAKNTRKKVVKQVQENNVLNKEKLSLYCDVCQVSASSQEVMKEHLKGKKHARRVVMVGTEQKFTQDGENIASADV